MRARTFLLTMCLVAVLSAHLHRRLHRAAAESGLEAPPSLARLMFGREDGEDTAGDMDSTADGKEVKGPPINSPGANPPVLARLARLRDALSAGPPRDPGWLSLREKALAEVRNAPGGEAAAPEAGEPARGDGAGGGREPGAEDAGLRLAAREGPQARGREAKAPGPRAGWAGRGALREALDKGGPAPVEEGPGFDGASDGAVRAWWPDFFGGAGTAARLKGRRDGKGEPHPARLPRISPKGLLGRRPLRPPPDGLAPPDFERLRAKYPASLPDGASYERADPAPRQAEDLSPPEESPDYKSWLEQDRLHGDGKPHWHRGSLGELYFHAGRAWGAPLGGRWGWLLHSSDHWWTVAEGGQRLASKAGRWWWRTRDGWFLLHEGEPWAWRYFAAWERYGLFHPATSTRVIYSVDGARVAVITPGWGAAVFDARTGMFLGVYPYP